MTLKLYYNKLSIILNITSIAPFSGGWNRLTTDLNPWIQANLGARHVLYGITTQGAPEYQNWVTSYYVSFGNDGVIWSKIATLFAGNTDRNTKVTNMLPLGSYGQFVRLHPETSNGYRTVRWDVLGKGKLLYTEGNYGNQRG